VVSGDDVAIETAALALGDNVDLGLLENVGEGSTSVGPAPSGDDTSLSYKALGAAGEGDWVDELGWEGVGGEIDHGDIVGESTGSIVRPTGVRCDGGDGVISGGSLTLGGSVVKSEYDLVGRGSRSDTVSSADQPTGGDERSSTGVRAARAELEGRLPWVLSSVSDVAASYDPLGVTGEGPDKAKSDNQKNLHVCRQNTSSSSINKIHQEDNHPHCRPAGKIPDSW